MKKSRGILFNIVTNLVLAFLVFSVGAISFIPTESAAGMADEEGVYRHAAETTGAISLCINVYWGTEEVYAILETLEEFNAKCTFFLGGCWADDNVACIKEIVSKGHELGNHGYFHKDHTKIGKEEEKQEIVRCNQFLALAAGVSPVLFAPPSGAYTAVSVSTAKALSMKVILWSRDTVDWRDKDEKIIYERATKNIREGEFVLAHPMAATVKALPKILEEYKRQGLRCVTVSENLQIGG